MFNSKIFLPFYMDGTIFFVVYPIYPYHKKDVNFIKMTLRINFFS
ncbi:UNVERIFIED_ORG: hypothetical protein M2402_003760 [Rahnella aquatilis]